jgi:hypothetical protein
MNFSIMSVDQKRDFLKELLSGNKVEVTFTKIDGSVRVMPCTLDPEFIPSKPVTEGKVVRAVKENPNVLRVFCLDKSEWRSFRLENIISIKVF